MLIQQRHALLIPALVAVVLMVLGVVFSQTALAYEPGTETDSETSVKAPEPAVPVPEPAPVDDTPEWSYRFLVPATMVLGTLAVVGSIFMYFVRVTKNRYRVVE
jgi:hypothetical protein